VARIGAGRPEVGVGSVEAIQNSQHPKTVVEFEMVKVVGFGRREEGEMVTGVRVQGRQQRQSEPEPGRGDVGAHNEHPQEGGQKVGEEMLDRVAVDCGDGDRGGPFVVLLVDDLVEVTIVEESVGVVESGLFDEDVHGQFVQDPVEGGELAQRRETPPGHGPVHDESGGKADNDLVEEHAPQHIEKFLIVDGLVRSGLDLVTAQGCRLVRHVQKSVDSSEEPIHPQTQDRCSVDPQVEGVLAHGIQKFVPLGLPEVARRPPESLTVPSTKHKE
jgi:hypothetical protein